MKIIDVSHELPTGGSNGRRFFRDICYAVVHHSAVLTGETYDPISRYQAEARYHIKKGWRRLAYHLIVARDGKVYQTNDFREIGYHAGSWKHNKLGLGICLDLDGSKQEMSDAQKSSLVELMKHLAYERPDLPSLIRTSFYTHREVRWPPGSTFCPSPQVQKVVVAFRKNTPV